MHTQEIKYTPCCSAANVVSTWPPTAQAALHACTRRKHYSARCSPYCITDAEIPLPACMLAGIRVVPVRTRVELGLNKQTSQRAFRLLKPTAVACNAHHTILKSKRTMCLPILLEHVPAAWRVGCSGTSPLWVRHGVLSLCSSCGTPTPALLLYAPHAPLSWSNAVGATAGAHRHSLR